MTLIDAEQNIIYQIVSICGDVRQRLSELGFNPGMPVLDGRNSCFPAKPAIAKAIKINRFGSKLASLALSRK